MKNKLHAYNINKISLIYFVNKLKTSNNCKVINYFY